ncbi:CLUMA_CG018194, isoform A, partial [Clunio marinus]
MDKRSFSVLVSPNKSSLLDHNSKKFKVTISPKKITQNVDEKNGNKLNLSHDINSELDGLCFDDDDFDEYFKNEIVSHENKLNLSNFSRCVVYNLEEAAQKFEKTLHLREKSTQETALCCLIGTWFDTSVQIGDVVSVCGVWNEDRKMFIVSSESGFIIVLPDTLVSGTTVVGSLFCARKSALAERFRPVILGDATAMNVGSMVHEIIQTVLRKNLTTLKEIRKTVDDYLKERDIIQLLYSSKMTMNGIYRELEPFITRIHEFMRQHIVCDMESEVNVKNQNQKPFTDRISEIQDIEENVWCPRLGLKGKIDVTVRVNPRNKFFNDFQKLMPLEIKTGKASFSMEHKGQLIIYQMMLQDLGSQIDSGLLLYIRDGIMTEIGATHSEKRGLIQMRNRLAHYLSVDLVTREKVVNLPEPISHHSACARCDYNTICCTLLKKQTNLNVTASNPLSTLKTKLTSHLTDDHVDYFLHWCHLITLEHNEAHKSIKLRHIWTKTPETRAAKGSALINLKITDLVQPHENDFIHHFRSSDANFEFTTSNFEVGEYLIVSTNKRACIAAGRVLKVETSVISLTLPRDLSLQYNKNLFHIDRYESQSQSVFNFSNVGVLLEDDKETNVNRLRKIIIDKQPASYTNNLPKIVMQKGEKILLQLNSVQRKAVLKALTCENYMLIKGLPGTGKTQTLVALIQLLMILKKSVLITSHTNSAVDNILLRLMDRGIKFMRLGSASRIHPLLRDFKESTIVAECKNVEELEKVYNEQQIVAVTCLGSSHALLSQRKFDYCLVDEATQIFQPTVIRPLISAEKFILVGDPMQLSPLVRSSEARSLGAHESLFERLDSSESTMILGLQYRMNRIITKLANNLTYNEQLKCGTEVVEKATMNVPKSQMLQQRLVNEKWLAKALSLHIDQSCSVINTGDVHQIAKDFAEEVNVEIKNEFADKSKIYVNYCEVAIVLHIVQLLIDCGVSGKAIGVIAPYRSQVEALKKIFVHHSTVE